MKGKLTFLRTKRMARPSEQQMIRNINLRSFKAYQKGTTPHDHLRIEGEDLANHLKNNLCQIRIPRGEIMWSLTTKNRSIINKRIYREEWSYLLAAIKWMKQYNVASVVTNCLHPHQIIII